MAQIESRYAHLPGIDNTGIEVYETPELTDDASTLRDTETNRSRSQSETSENLNDNFDRTHIHAGSARSRFLPSRVDARDVDFSDRLSDRRRTYKSATRTRRRDREVITAEDEDDNVWSDDDAGEALARKLARLTREVEEVKSEYARQQTESAPADKNAEGIIESLGKALDGVRTSQQYAESAHARIAKQLLKPASSTSRTPDAQSVLPQPTPDQSDDPLLSQLAAFESRLTDLERSLGLASLDPHTPTPPILPTLSSLDKQLSFLVSSDAKSHLETLAAETESLAPAPAPNATQSTSANPPAAQDSSPDPSTAQLQSLVSLLPTLRSQSEVLPHLLSRLSTLRHVHARAESASTSLEELERRQREIDGEIQAWRDGLQKVEDVVRGAEQGLKVNVETVEEWVRALEERVKTVLR